MIFMSQSGLTDVSQQDGWDAWYVEHLRIMRTVPGITSAQRFKTDSPDYSPSLAMYTIVSESVFRDPYYLSIRGMGEWKPLIDTRFYHRNLFSGLDVAPVVRRDQLLIIADRPEPDPSMNLTWLQSIGLDKSTPWRGLAVVEADQAHNVEGKRIGVYVPVTG